MNQRYLGFDVARAYAIFGMFIVNFNFCFGTFRDDSTLVSMLSLFVGNSTSIFIICAGMGVVFMSNGENKSLTEKKEIKSIIVKRSWVLFFLGILLYSWWPGDILHFYGGYMHIAVFMLYTPKKYYLWLALLFIGIYNLLQLFIPITTSWDLKTTIYADFWTPIGFLRNTFYNGWNSVFPWFAYFLIGMYLGKVNWQEKNILKKIFLVGFILFAIFKGLRIFIKSDFHNIDRNWFYEKYWFQLMEDYFPANIPYLMITTGFALMVISVCMYLGNKFSKTKIINILAKTGQMTLSLYVFHITVGVIILSLIASKNYTGTPTMQEPVSPFSIFTYCILFFLMCVLGAYLWNKKFKKGPMETLMRKISN